MKVVPKVTSEREEGGKILANSCIRDSGIMGATVIESRVMRELESPEVQLVVILR